MYMDKLYSLQMLDESKYEFNDEWIGKRLAFIWTVLDYSLFMTINMQLTIEKTRIYMLDNNDKVHAMATLLYESNTYDEKVKKMLRYREEIMI